jgi:hypothetical protein
MKYNTIKIKKYSDVIEEYEAYAAIAPGELVQIYSADDAKTTVKPHATAAGNAVPMFALEDELQGRGIADTYAAGDRVQVWIPGRGDIVYAILANGQHIEIGDWLESNGDGYLQKHVADVGDSTVGTVQKAIIGQALESKDLSAGSDQSVVESAGDAGLGASARIRVRIV